MQCDMCGKEAPLFCTEVEATKLDLCQTCSKFGKVLFMRRPPVNRVETKKVEHRKQATAEQEIIEILTEDYAKKIKEAREKTGLKQIEFAKRISEKESLIQNIESGKFEPSIALAKKLEKILKITLIEQHQEGKAVIDSEGKHEKRDSYTLGDFIRVKKK